MLSAPPASSRANSLRDRFTRTVLPSAVRSSNLTLSTPSTCRAPVKRAVFGQDAYPELASKAAALLHSLCRNRALIDGNKRLAWAAAVVFIGLNDDRPVRDVDVDRAEAFMFAVADGSLAEVSAIAAELRRLGVVD
ncbi:MAG TPA: Fic family protein [Micromonosporaceae bacterium]